MCCERLQGPNHAHRDSLRSLSERSRRRPLYRRGPHVATPQQHHNDRQTVAIGIQMAWRYDRQAAGMIDICNVNSARRAASGPPPVRATQNFLLSRTVEMSGAPRSRSWALLRHPATHARSQRIIAATGINPSGSNPGRVRHPERATRLEQPRSGSPPVRHQLAPESWRDRAHGNQGWVRIAVVRGPKRLDVGWRESKGHKGIDAVEVGDPLAGAGPSRLNMRNIAVVQRPHACTSGGVKPQVTNGWIAKRSLAL